MKKQIFFALGALAALASCSGDMEDAPLNSARELRVFCSYPGSASKATDTNWEAGDCIGVTGNGAANILYNFADGTSFSSPEGIRIEKGDASVFTAYYPYASGLADGAFIDFDITNQKDVDFLWAEAEASEGAVNFVFSHMMSKLTVKLVDKDKQYDGSADLKITVRLKDQVLDGKFNVATGEVIPGSSKGSIEQVIYSFDSMASFIIPSYPEGTNADKIMIEIEVEADGGSISDLYQVYDPLTPRKGKSYPDVLSLTKNSAGAAGSIEDWKKEEGEFQWW